MATISSRIALANCINRHTYAIYSRNLRYGVFNLANGGFIGIREKFNSYYLFTEYHWEVSETLGTVSPYVDLGAIPDDMDLRERNPPVCSGCGRLIAFKQHKEPKPEGVWYHMDDESLMEEGAYPGSTTYQPMFDYLTKVETKHSWVDIMIGVGRLDESDRKYYS